MSCASPTARTRTRFAGEKFLLPRRMATLGAGVIGSGPRCPPAAPIGSGSRVAVSDCLPVGGRCQSEVDHMSRGFPSLAALLGVLAIAGYQNRDKLAELLRDAQGKLASGGAQQGSDAGPLGNLGGLLGGTSIGGLLGGGLKDLVDSLNSSGKGEIADSWVKTGPNKPISPQELERAISPEVWASLSEHTGLSRQELLSRLSRELPDAVDRYTPEGRLPTPA
jgi:uncharacterized protein YidB (DUF937 family)